MQVHSYDLFLDVDFQGLRFDGRVQIDLESEGDVALNSLGLSILSVRGGGNPYRFEQHGEELLVKTGPFTGILEIEYSGLIPDTLVGFYRAPYNGTYIVTTQFEAAHARRLLPCVDLPGYKAEFKLAVKISNGLDAVSNMPVESVRLEGDEKLISFQKTPRMSTYLLYLGVGKFDEIQDRFSNIDVIVATTPGKVEKGRFALDVAEKSMKFYQSYFEVPYALPKIHLVAIPEFAAGAMENWGAVTFKEALLLVDESSGVRTRKGVAEVVAHELAHQWVGNLVTMKWWDDLWLNESFATFMAYKVMDAIYPHLGVWRDFLNSVTSSALSRDSLKNTHPIEVPLKSADELEQIFDDISYGKGANVLRMVEAYVGDEAFRRGVTSYLNRYKFSNTTGEDLWRALDEASGKQVSMVMREWVKKPGYPMIVASMRGEKLVLRQERFLLSGTSEDDVWPIPVTMKVDGDDRLILLDRKEVVIDVKGVRSLKLNVDQTGFYRVYYDGLYDKVWRSGLSEFDRWGIVSDALAFVVAGKLPFSEYLSILRRCYSEEGYLPAFEVSDQLAFLYSIMPSRVAEVSREFHRSQLKVLEGKADDNSLMLKGIVAGRLAMVDEEYAKELGAGFHDYSMVKPDMRGAVAVAYARGYSDLEEVTRRYMESVSDEERVELLSAMMCFKEASLVALSLKLALSGKVKRQDVASMIMATTRNPDSHDVAWTWLKVNMEMLGRLYEGTGRLSRVLQAAIPILGIGRVDEVEKFFEENKMPGAEKGIEVGLERLRIYDRLAKATL